MYAIAEALRNAHREMEDGNLSLKEFWNYVDDYVGGYVAVYACTSSLRSGIVGYRGRRFNYCYMHGQLEFVPTS